MLRPLWRTYEACWAVDMRARARAAFLFCLVLNPLAMPLAHAGAQQEEVLAASVQAMLQSAVSDQASPEPEFPSVIEKVNWLSTMSERLIGRMPDPQQRIDFLKTVYYESQRAGLDPQLVLGLIQVESGFRKYAVSGAGARGYMQVMPFWAKLIGTRDTNLFHLRTNLRYGCTILRHYLDIEKGDLYRALGRYNGSLGKPEYPNMVRAAWEKNWAWPPSQATNLSSR